MIIKNEWINQRKVDLEYFYNFHKEQICTRSLSTPQKEKDSISFLDVVRTLSYCVAWLIILHFVQTRVTRVCSRILPFTAALEDSEITGDDLPDTIMQFPLFLSE